MADDQGAAAELRRQLEALRAQSDARLAEQRAQSDARLAEQGAASDGRLAEQRSRAAAQLEAVRSEAAAELRCRLDALQAELGERHLQEYDRLTGLIEESDDELQQASCSAGAGHSARSALSRLRVRCDVRVVQLDDDCEYCVLALIFRRTFERKLLTYQCSAPVKNEIRHCRGKEDLPTFSAARNEEEFGENRQPLLLI